MTVEILCLAIVTDFVRCCTFQIQTTKSLIKPFKRPSKVNRGHRQCHPSLDHLDILLHTGKIGHTYFQTKIAEMTLRADECHWL